MSLLLISAMLALASAAAVDEWDSKETRAVQLRYGECVVKKRQSAARNFVLTPDLEKGDLRRHIQMVGDPECLVAAAENGVEMKFPLDTMRYALADALVRKEFSLVAPPSLKNAGAIDQPDFDDAKYQPKPGKQAKKKELDELAEKRIKRLALIYLAQYGECVVRAAPDQSRTLLLATPDTPEESAAFAALKPELGGCVVEGQSLKFNKATLRGTIAMNFYRLTYAARQSATTAGVTK